MKPNTDLSLADLFSPAEMTDLGIPLKSVVTAAPVKTPELTDLFTPAEMDNLGISAKKPPLFHVEQLPTPSPIIEAYQPKPEDIKIPVPEKVEGVYGEDIARQKEIEAQNVKLYGTAIPKGKDYITPAIKAGAAAAVNVAGMVPQIPRFYGKWAESEYENWGKEVDAAEKAGADPRWVEDQRGLMKANKRNFEAARAGLAPVIAPISDKVSKKIYDFAETISPMKEQANEIKELFNGISGSHPEAIPDIINSAKLGILDLLVDWYSAEAMARGDKTSADEMKKLGSDYLNAQAGEQKYGAVREILKGVARMGPGLVGSMAVSAIPYAGPALTFSGWAAQGAGQVFRDAIESGADPEKARLASIIAAPIYAAIENLQIGRLKAVPALDAKKSIKSIVLKYMREHLLRTGLEVNEEGLQGITTTLATEIAKGNDDPNELAKASVKSYLENAYQALPSMFLVGGPATAMGAAHEVSSLKGRQTTPERPKTDILPVVEPKVTVPVAPTGVAERLGIAPPGNKILADFGIKDEGGYFALPVTSQEHVFGQLSKDEQTRLLEYEPPPAVPEYEKETIKMPVVTGEEVQNAGKIRGYQGRPEEAGAETRGAVVAGGAEKPEIPGREDLQRNEEAGRTGIEPGLSRAQGLKFGPVQITEEQKDHLTGLPDQSFTKAKVAQVGEKEWTGTADIDHFKAINEIFGHAVGDKILGQVGAKIAAHFPEYFTGREGGEEFHFNFGNDRPAQERLTAFHSDISENVKLPSGEGITISMGVGRDGFIDEDKVKHLISDLALHDAKKGGRNQIVIENSDGKLYTIKGEEKRHGYLEQFAERQVETYAKLLRDRGKITSEEFTGILGTVQKGERGKTPAPVERRGIRAPAETVRPVEPTAKAVSVEAPATEPKEAISAIPAEGEVIGRRIAPSGTEEVYNFPSLRKTTRANIEKDIADGYTNLTLHEYGRDRVYRWYKKDGTSQWFYANDWGPVAATVIKKRINEERARLSGKPPASQKDLAVSATEERPAELETETKPGEIAPPSAEEKIFREKQKKRAARAGIKPGAPVAELRKKRDKAMDKAKNALKRLGQSFEKRDPNTLYMVGTEQADLAFEAVSALIEAGYYEFRAIAQQVNEMAREFVAKKGFMETIEDAYDAHAEVNDALKKRGDETMARILENITPEGLAKQPAVVEKGAEEKPTSVSAPEARPAETAARGKEGEYAVEPAPEGWENLSHDEAWKLSETFRKTIDFDDAARDQLRKDIADKLFTDGKMDDVRKNRSATLILGLPAAGKSTVAETETKFEKAALIDVDEAKKLIPEYRDGLGATAVHKESSLIIDDYLMPDVIKKGINIVWPITGANEKNVENRINVLKDNGYTIRVVYVKVPVDVARKRIIDRWAITKRITPVENLDELYLNIDRNYGILKGRETGMTYDEIDGITGKVLESGGEQGAVGEANAGGQLPGSERGAGGNKGAGRGGAGIGGPVGELQKIAGEKPVTKEAVNVAPGRRTAELEGKPAENVPGTAEERTVNAPPAGEGRTGIERGGEAGVRRNEPVGGEGNRAPGPVVAAGERGTVTGREPTGTARGAERRELSEDNARETAPRDYSITDSDEIGTGGAKEKFRNNIAAIQILKTIEKEERRATTDEQKVLVKYIGWGMFPQVFVNQEEVDPKWKKEAKELRDLLTDEEFKAANRSILNAHFSHITVIRSMWNAVRRMGFNGGRILEPAVGVGHFFGLRPADLKYTMSGIDLDKISGRIAQNLYQTSDIKIQGYETVPLVNGSYDLIISNVPFARIKPFDAESKKYGFEPRSLSLHDYYFLKSLYGVREGGMVAFITSRYTMDKQDSSVRRKIAERADLLGAIRFPNTAFKDNAGTEVVTDIIYLQKRREGEKMSDLTETFLSLKPIELKNEKDEKKEALINQYYIDHPEMIIGKQSLQGSMYTENEYTVYLNADKIGGQLAEAIKKLPENVMVPVTENEQLMTDNLKTAMAPANVGVGSYFIKDGKIYTKLNAAGEGRTAFLSEKEIPRTRAMIAFKEVFRSVFRRQLKTGGAGATDLKRLNNVYDAFTKRFGVVHLPQNVKLIDQDPELAGLLALEKWDEENKVASKGSFLSGKLAAERETAIKIETAEDAYLDSLASTGVVNWGLMAKKSGKDIATLQKELLANNVIYIDPAAAKEGQHGVFVPREEYLSGDVRKKLREAQEAAKTDETFLNNVAQLQKVQPPAKGPGQIAVPVNSPILSARDIQGFANQMFMGREESEEINVHHDSLTGKYTVRNNRKQMTHNTEKWGVNYTPEIVDGREGILAWYGHEIFDAMLNNARISIRYNRGTSEEPDFIIDEKATTVAREKAEMLKEEFKRWVWRDVERAKRLVDVFNEVYNNIAERKYIHPLRVKNPDLKVKPFGNTFELRENQADALWRVLQSKNTMLAHGVGAGKTAIATGAAMEMRRLGMRKKPLIVVPNHMIPQWQAEILTQYPGARVLAATTTNFDDKTARREFLNKAALGDFDIVLMRYSHFKMISLTPAIQQEFVQERIGQYKEALRRIEKESEKATGGRGGGRKKSKTRAQKVMENRLAKLETKLADLMDMKKDVGFPYFDEMGFDQMFIDEADNFKNLDYTSGIQNILGMGDPNGAEQSIDMHMKVQHIQRKGGGIVFMTGTPISNSLVEAYTMMRYLQPEELDKRNLGCFDEWQRMFAEPVTQWELNASGTGLKQRTRFSKFNNVQELTRILRQSWDVMTGSMLQERGILRHGHELPMVKREIVKSNVTPLLAEYLDHLGERERAIEERKGPPEPGDDIHLVVIAHGKLASIDMRLIHPSLPDEPGSKLNRVIGQAFKNYKDHPGTTGLMFYDMTRPRNKGEKMFDVYAEIKRKLVEMGVPAKEIALIHDFPTDVKKLQLFSDMNAARVRILIGNTQKVGAGTNIQHKMKWELHVDGPHRPRDIIQREGRIDRPGNSNKEIIIGTAISKGSHDQSVWEMLQRKAAMIDNLISGQDQATNHVEEEDPFAEASIAAIGTPLMKQRAETKAQVKKLSAMIENTQNEQYVARDKIEHNNAIIEQFEEKIEKHKTLLKNLKAPPEEGTTRITTNDGKELKARDKANKYIVDYVKENKNDMWYRYRPVFKIGDVEISLQMSSDDRFEIQLENGDATVNIEGPSNPVLVLSTVEEFIWKKKGDTAWYEQQIGRLKKENAEHADVLKQDTDDLAKKLDNEKTRLTRIEKDIAVESKKKAEERSKRGKSGYNFYELEENRRHLAKDEEQTDEEKRVAAEEAKAIEEAKKRHPAGPEFMNKLAGRGLLEGTGGRIPQAAYNRIVIGDLHEVLQVLPAGTIDKLTLTQTDHFEANGKEYDLGGPRRGAMYYNEKSGDLNIWMAKDIQPQEIAEVLWHELPGHYGSAMVFRANIKIYESMKDFFRTERKAGHLDRLINTYRKEMSRLKNPEAAESLLFSEWTAEQVTNYLNNSDRGKISTRIYNYLREMLVRVGILKEQIDDVLWAMVKQMKTLPAEGVKTEGQPMFLQKDFSKIYADAVAEKPTMMEKLTHSNKSFRETTDRIVADVMVPISTRLKTLGQEFKDQMRKFEFESLRAETKDTKNCKPFLDATKKMEPEDRVILDLALKNGDAEKTTEIVKKYGLEREYGAVRDVLDAIHARAVESGFDVNYVQEYWPRLVLNSEGLLNILRDLPEWGVIEEQIAKQQELLGRPLSEFEQAQIANTFISRHEGITQAVGNIKERTIAVIDKNLDKYYDYSTSALVNYLHEMNQAIETRKFFGMDKKKPDPDAEALGIKMTGESAQEGTKFTDVEGSIGNYVLTAVKEGRLDPAQQDELIGVLRARFNYKPSGKVMQTVKNVGYMTSMGSGFSSCFTQFGDFTWAYYVTGPLRASKALAKSFIGKSELRKEDLGLDRIAEEFRTSKGFGKALNKVFDWTLLTRFDAFGKEALINGLNEKYRAAARKDDPALRRHLEKVFGEEAGQTIEDLKAGHNSENVRYLLFTRLLDFQPLALSEMPVSYLKSPNGRILYMLKTFTVKQIDAFRNECSMVISKGLKEGNKKMVYQGVINLMYLTALFILCNAAGDKIKDLIFGRVVTMEQWFVDNMLRLIGMSRFIVWETRQNGPVMAFWKLIAPPLDIIEAPLRDFWRIIGKTGDVALKIKNAETWKLVPFFGKHWYWWFGGGHQQSIERAAKSDPIAKLEAAQNEAVKKMKEAFKKGDYKKADEISNEYVEKNAELVEDAERFATENTEKMIENQKLRHPRKFENEQKSEE